MIDLETKTLKWGISSDATPITSCLFTDQLFVFKHQAQAYCDEAKEILGNVNLAPVLVVLSATLASQDDSIRYESEQSEWLSRNRQSKEQA